MKDIVAEFVKENDVDMADLSHMRLPESSEEDDAGEPFELYPACRPKLPRP